MGKQEYLESLNKDEEVCIIVQTAFFNKDNELIAIKYENNLKDESLFS